MNRPTPIKTVAATGLAILFALHLHPVHAEVPQVQAQVLETFQTFDARQGVAVDATHFYAINNFSLTRHDKKTGQPQLQWDGGSDVGGPLIHLDGAVIHDGLLYAAHSNYPHWPMTSSIEIWNPDTMEHVGSHSLGVQYGSLTWIDYHAGQWWGAFANYDKIQDGMDQPYGETRNTVIVRFDDQFRVVRSWTLPAEILKRMTPMSNSGGSWGNDNLLYLTGHDYPEIYVMGVPATGSELQWLATVHVDGLNGQGIAWDRSGPARELWAILKQEELVYRIAVPPIPQPAAFDNDDYLRGPGDFATNR